MLIMLGKISADAILKYHLYFPAKIGCDVRAGPRRSEDGGALTAEGMYRAA